MLRGRRFQLCEALPVRRELVEFVRRDDRREEREEDEEERERSARPQKDARRATRLPDRPERSADSRAPDARRGRSRSFDVDLSPQ
jgi:hypothetical protein